MIDDVWTNSAWETIQCALPKNAHASKIILTTRINSVGQFSCTPDEGFIYQMKPLCRNDSENLFLKRTLCDKDKFPAQLEGIKNEIIEKCDGLPLAIVTLASMLATKQRTREEWERALDSIHSTHKKDSSLEVMDKILSLSYRDLPHNMRNCLLYLSTFPEDHTIYKDALVWRWMAEGFIAETQGFTLEQVAEGYFYEFVNRSLVQPITLRSRYEMRGEGGCRVHDIVLNFLISRAAEENFLTTLYGAQGVPSSDRRIRRLSVWDSPEHALAVSRATMNLSHLRSVRICNVGDWPVPAVLDLPVLRVLDLEGCRDLRIVDPDCILSLFHLRYLGFRSASGVVLPAQIGNLHHLQTIDLSGTGVTQLPESIVQLKRLMHLVGQRLIMPDGFGSMESLEELGTIDCCKCPVSFGEDLALLSRLRVLRVAFIGVETSDMETRMKSLMSSLCKLGGDNLRRVTIIDLAGGGDCFVESWHPPPRLLQKFIHISQQQHFSRFPEWISSCLCDLTHLDIKAEKMEREHLSVLEHLPAIRCLYLFVKRVSEDGLAISHGAFRCLRRLEFCNVDGPGLMFAGGVPMLEWLRLGFDADRAQSTYGGLEVGIQRLSSLKHVVLIVWMVSEGGDDPAEQAVWSAINGQVEMLPNSPTVDIRFRRRSQLQASSE